MTNQWLSARFVMCSVPNSTNSNWFVLEYQILVEIAAIFRCHFQVFLINQPILYLSRLPPKTLFLKTEEYACCWDWSYWLPVLENQDICFTNVDLYMYNSAFYLTLVLVMLIFLVKRLDMRYFFGLVGAIYTMYTAFFNVFRLMIPMILIS